jgi:hypothetical protein
VIPPKVLEKGSEEPRAGVWIDSVSPDKLPTISFIRRFVEQGLGGNRDNMVNVYSNATLLPRDFEYVFSSSKRHPKAQRA